MNGFDLYYREVAAAASSTPVVILHGGPGHSSESFDAGFDFLANEYRVVYYDQRGSGNSQIKPDSTLYTIEHLVEELESLRRDVIGAERMIVVGHSTGGALAQRYPLTYTEHVDRMVLVSSIPIHNGVSLPILWDAFGPALFVLGAGTPPADPQAANEWFSETMETSAVARLRDPGNWGILEDSGVSPSPHGERSLDLWKVTITVRACSSLRPGH